MSDDPILPIIELYPCVQGEGSRRGYPTIAVRTTGCTHRCYFGEQGGWCDTWYSSIHAIKGKYRFSDVIALYKRYPHIKEMMITGGSPTMHSDLMNQLTSFADQQGIYTTLETEGSYGLQTTIPFDLVSLSPKLSNSIPLLGIKTPKGKIVDQRFVDQHNKHRCNIEAMQSLMRFHRDYQLKVVCDGRQTNLAEIKTLVDELGVPHNKVFLMPAGSTRTEMIKQYPILMELALAEGFNFTGRDHIIAYNDKIEV